MTDDPKAHRAVFIPPGLGPRVVFGKTGSGDLVHVIDAERGLTCKLTCPDCGGQLVANKGAIKAAYFSHYSRIECEHAGESALHIMAKEIIEKNGWFDLPLARAWSLWYGHDDVHPPKRVHFTRVEVEPRQVGFQPDLIGIKEVVKNGRKVVGRLHIEIYVTHKVDEKKMDLLRERGESVLEVDLSKVQRAITKSELADLLIKDDNKEWLFHRDVERREAHLAAIEEDRIAKKDKRKRDVARRIMDDRKQWEDSLNTPPSEATPKQAAFSDRERQKWCEIGCEHYLDAKADDRYFNVPPDVWRALALSALAPWHDNSKGWIEDNRGDDLPATISNTLKAAGWVKKPFSSKYQKKQCDHGYELVYWDRAADQVRILFEAALSGKGYPSVWDETKKLKMLLNANRTKYDHSLRQRTDSYGDGAAPPPLKAT